MNRQKINKSKIKVEHKHTQIKERLRANLQKQQTIHDNINDKKKRMR